MFFQTRGQAKQHMMNLKRELESNILLKSDLGPFEEESDEWGSSSLVFSNTGARITVASMEQSVRGLRHNQHRPDLIICDDVEDMASVKTHESRQKTYQWLTGEVIPGGAPQTRLIVIGNLLHEDSLVMRLKRDMDEGQREGVFKMFPLLSANETIAWPGKYPTMADIEVERKKSGNQYAWQREYLLNIVPDEDQVIHRDWIQYYDDVPTYTGNFISIAVGVDLAISQKDTADYTAMVSGIISGHEDKFCLYILPNPINKRLTFPQTIEQIKSVYAANQKIFSRVEILVENVGYQQAVIDQLAHDVYGVKGIKVSGDKRSRLMTVSAMIQNGKIKFPRFGCEDLIRQIVGFGVERHDDLVDAFSIVAHHGLEIYGKPTPRITIINTRSLWDSWPDDDRF
jgi:predicted phage terminase large subunit-like protein